MPQVVLLGGGGRERVVARGEGAGVLGVHALDEFLVEQMGELIELVADVDEFEAVAGERVGGGVEVDALAGVGVRDQFGGHVVAARSR